ncbi:MAG: hypothetical protein QXF01_01815 [Candidatus Micrarchaeaceae archaeon]
MDNPAECFIASIHTHDMRSVPKSVMDLMAVSIALRRKFVLNAQSGT